MYNLLCTVCTVECALLLHSLIMLNICYCYSSPASFEPGTNPSPRHEQSQRRQQSPGRQQTPRRQQSPGRRYTRSPARSVSPGYRHMSPNRHASRLVM